MVRTRFAPSPTGIPHLGGIRTALYNYLFAKHNNGEFLLRIEDTDRKRLVEEAEDAILDSLTWLGLNWNGEVIHQSERVDIYKKHAQILLDKKIAYEKEGAVWVKVPDNKIFSWADLIGNKKITFNGKDVEDFVILKSDGFPTYHLANIVDDHLMQITHVIRGEEWISSVPKHIFLYESFGFQMPNFAHLPVILGPDKGKLSKRHGAKSIGDYKDEGYLKEALLNFLALLGWSFGVEEIISLDEMIKAFDLKDVNTANPKFDPVKLEWMNGEYIRRFEKDNALEEILKERYKTNENISWVFESTYKDLIIGLAATRMKALNDFENLALQLSRTSVSFTVEEKQTARNLLKFLKNEAWEDKDFIEVLRKFNKEEQVDFKNIYYLLTGQKNGLPLPEILKIKGGKSKFLQSLEENFK
jgi:glutamyl-tRNA synthetase